MQTEVNALAIGTPVYNATDRNRPMGARGIVTTVNVGKPGTYLWAYGVTFDGETKEVGCDRVREDGTGLYAVSETDPLAQVPYVATEPASFPFAGTVSYGTLQTYSLLYAFWRTLVEMDGTGRYADLARRVADLLTDLKGRDEASAWTDDETDDAAYLVNEELPDALNALAPDGYTFGAHEGDGSDFGFWASPVEFDGPEYLVSGDYLGAIINGDYGRLEHETPNEARSLRAWLKAEAATHGPGHWDTDNDDEGQYAECDVSGCYTTCHVLRYVTMG